jgi:hypothetical protein
VLRTGFHCDYEHSDLTHAHTSVCKLGCLCHLTRFQILFESEQLAALRRIQERTTAPVASQIRRAFVNWVAGQGEKTEHKRPASRARSSPVNQGLGWSSGLPTLSREPCRQARTSSDVQKGSDAQEELPASTSLIAFSAATALMTVEARNRVETILRRGVDSNEKPCIVWTDLPRTEPARVRVVPPH